MCPEAANGILQFLEGRLLSFHYKNTQGVSERAGECPCLSGAQVNSGIGGWTDGREIVQRITRIRERIAGP